MSAAFKKISSFAARRQPVEASSTAQTLAPVVLLVEPNESARSVMQVALTRDGFEVIAVESAEEALRQLAQGLTPAAVVAESELANLDGFGFCGQLRAEQSTAHVPVILLSCHAESYHPEMANSAGADDYLPKPLFARDVVSLVRLKTSARAVDGTIHAHTDGLPLPHLLRALLAGTRSGRIELSGGQAQIAFRQGRVIDATFGGFRGADALMRVLLLASGEYTVSLGPSLARATLSYGLRELVTSAFPRIARWQGLVAHGVPIDARLEVDFAQLAKVLTELPDGVNDIVRLFDGRRTVRDVLIDGSLSEVLALEVITRLYAMGVVAPVAEEEAEDELGLSPRTQPKLFEPAPLEAHERMTELFGAEAPAPVEAAPAEDDDWTESSLFADALAAEVPEGWTAAPLQAPAFELMPEEREGLSPEVSRQLDAFRIRPVVEPLDVRPAPRELEGSDLELFLKGARPEETQSLAESVHAMQTPIPLTEVVGTAPIRLTRVAGPASEDDLAPMAEVVELAPVAPVTAPAPDAQEIVSLEESFFADATEAAPAVAQPKRRGKAVDLAGILIAVALLSGGAGVVAWRMSSGDDVGTAPAAAAKISEIAMPAEEVTAPVAAATDVAVPADLHAAPVLLAPPAAEPAALDPTAPVPLVPAATAPAAPSVEQGIALYDAGKTKAAAEQLMSVVDADPNATQAWLFLGLARFDAGDRFGAEDAAMRTLALDQKNGRAVMLLASIYLDQGQRQKAAVELKRYLELEPKGPFASDARELLSSF